MVTVHLAYGQNSPSCDPLTHHVSQNIKKQKKQKQKQNKTKNMPYIIQRFTLMLEVGCKRVMFQTP